MIAGSTRTQPWSMRRNSIRSSAASCNATPAGSTRPPISRQAARSSKRTAHGGRALLPEEEIEPLDDGVRWRGEDFSHVVFCRGADERTGSRFFSWLKFDCARGVIASLKVDLQESRIINRGCWLLPRGAGDWRAGSTYEFDLKTPMEASLADLRGKLALLLRVPFEICGAQAGIRPIIKHRQLVLGPHPAHPRVCVFNGLGSKGVLRAPFFARMLAEHLLDDKPPGPDVDVRAND